MIADQMGLGSIGDRETHPRVHGQSFPGVLTDAWGYNDGEGQACSGCGQHLLTSTYENGKGKLAEGRVAPGKPPTTHRHFEGVPLFWTVDHKHH